MRIKSLLQKFQEGGYLDELSGIDFSNPANFALYQELAGLEGQEFADAMLENFGMQQQEILDEQGNPTGEFQDFSVLFQQYDSTAEEALRDTFTTAKDKAKSRARNNLAEAFQLARTTPGGFGGVGKPLQSALGRVFSERDTAFDTAQQQYYGGAFDLQEDFASSFEDQLANLSAMGVEFINPLNPDESDEGEGDEGEGGNEDVVIDDSTEEVNPTDPTDPTDIYTDFGEDFGGGGFDAGPGQGEDNSCNNPQFAAAYPNLCNPSNVNFDDTAQEAGGDMLGNPFKTGEVFGGN